jgi:hypothetical protein
MAEKDNRRHGRLKANGFVAIVEGVPEENRSFTAQAAPQAAAKDESSATQSVAPTVSAPIVAAAPTPSLSARGGCSPLSALGIRMPGGCGMRGCGFLAIIPLLLVLLGMLRQCQGNNHQQNEKDQNGGRQDGRGDNRQGEGTQNGDGQNGNDQDRRTREGATVIYDTVYVERVKERVDTLRLFMTDTVEMIESSKQTVFKPVVLPNVQFYTNSANLIPTSLSDIQQLAQHLIDTPQLDAVVISTKSRDRSECDNFDGCRSQSNKGSRERRQ